MPPPVPSVAGDSTVPDASTPSATPPPPNPSLWKQAINDKRRYLDDLLQDSSVREVHARARSINLPTGPIAGEWSQVQLAVTSWSSNPSTNGGGWGVSVCRTRPAPTKGRGDIKALGCQHRKSKQQGNKGAIVCPWEVEYQEAREGWVLVHANLEHSGHELASSQAEVMASSTGRYIPPDFYELGLLLGKSQSTPQIMEAFRNKAKEDNIPISWNEQDIRQAFVRPHQNDNFEVAHLVELLMSRERDKGCKSFVQTNNAKEFARIFVELDDGFKEWATTDANVVLFDPTWGTNKYGMKLCCFTTVAGNGQTVILAFAIINTESTDDIHWSLQSFHAVFKKAPGVFFSDEAASIAAAFVRMRDSGLWSSTVHLLCIFHLSKNFFKHLRAHFGEWEDWRTLNSWFWMLAKYSDDRFDEEAEWQSLMEFVQSRGTGDKLEQALQWLERLYARKQQWMAKYACAFLSWGIRSTQRAESMHAAIKKKRLANSVIVNLIQALIDLNTASRDKKKVDEIRLALRQQIGAEALPPIIASQRAKLSPFGYDLLLSQYGQALKYAAEELEGEFDDQGNQYYLVKYTGEYKPGDFSPVLNEDGQVKSWISNVDFGIGDCDLNQAGHVTSLLDCSCQYENFFGIPCRHKIWVSLRDQANELMFLHRDGSKWFTLEPADTQRAVFNLRMTPASRASGAPYTKPETTRSDRHAIIMDELSAIVDVAAATEDNTDILLKSLPALRSAIQAGRILIPLSAQASEPAATACSGGSADHAQASAAALSRDQSALQKVIGTQHVPRTQVSQALLNNTDAMIGKFIAYKFSSRGKGGFWRGQITSSSDQSVKNYVAHFTDDNTDVHVYLGLDNVWNPQGSASCPKDSWVLLDERSLGDDVQSMAADGNLHMPGKVGKGRPHTVRAAVAAGPTAKKRK